MDAQSASTTRPAVTRCDNVKTATLDDEKINSNVYDRDRADDFLVRRVLELERSCVILTPLFQTRVKVFKSLLDTIPLDSPDKCLIFTIAHNENNWKQIVDSPDVSVLRYDETLSNHEKYVRSIKRWRMVFLDAFDVFMPQYDQETASTRSDMRMILDRLWKDRLYIFRSNCAEIALNTYYSVLLDQSKMRMDFIDESPYSERANVFYVRHGYAPFEDFMAAVYLYSLKIFRLPNVAYALNKVLLAPDYEYALYHVEQSYSSDARPWFNAAFQDLERNDDSSDEVFKSFHVYDCDHARALSDEHYVSSRMRAAVEAVQHARNKNPEATVAVLVDDSDVCEYVESSLRIIIENASKVLVLTAARWKTVQKKGLRIDAALFLLHRGQDVTALKIFKTVTDAEIDAYVFSGRSEIEQQYCNCRYDRFNTFIYDVFKSVHANKSAALTRSKAFETTVAKR